QFRDSINGGYYQRYHSSPHYRVTADPSPAAMISLAGSSDLSVQNINPSAMNHNQNMGKGALGNSSTKKMKPTWAIRTNDKKSRLSKKYSNTAFAIHAVMAPAAITPITPKSAYPTAHGSIPGVKPVRLATDSNPG